MQDANFQRFISKILNEKLSLHMVDGVLEKLSRTHLTEWRDAIKTAIADAGHDQDVFVSMTATSPNQLKVEIQVGSLVAIRQLDW